MTPEQLKASILQMAIQGKLVEQRPEEGTAEELYDQIQAEKQSLVRAGKIRCEYKINSPALQFFFHIGKFAALGDLEMDQRIDLPEPSDELRNDLHRRCPKCRDPDTAASGLTDVLRCLKELVFQPDDLTDDVQQRLCLGTQRDARPVAVNKRCAKLLLNLANIAPPINS